MVAQPASGMTGASALPSRERRPRSLEDDERDLAALLRAGKLRSVIGITCRGRRDGAGNQAMEYALAMAYARSTGCRYLHTPFAIMDHAAGGAWRAWADRWERFLDLGAGEALVPAGAELAAPRDIVANPAFYADRPIAIAAEAFMSVGWLPRAELRAKYWRNPKRHIPLHHGPAGSLTVAIHVRRGDVGPHHPRYVPDEVALCTIERMRRLADEMRCRLHFNVYSEGAAEDFAAYAAAGCRLHLRIDAFEAFHNMVTADILVPTWSSFSRFAALLSTGVIVARENRPPERDRFVLRRRDGSFSAKTFRRALLSRMGWRERWAYRIRRALHRKPANAR
jgi:hypothetical protein